MFGKIKYLLIPPLSVPICQPTYRIPDLLSIPPDGAPPPPHTHLPRVTSLTTSPPSRFVSRTSAFITDNHEPPQLVLDITLCGDWAGVPSVYNATCSGGTTGVCVSFFGISANGGLTPSTQYTDNVIGPGSPRYDNAYFQINYIRVYSVNGLTPSFSSSSYHTSTGSSSKPTNAGTGTANRSNTDVMLDVSSSLRLFVLLSVGVLVILI
jgi:hypothetical protein